MSHFPGLFALLPEEIVDYIVDYLMPFESNTFFCKEFYLAIKRRYKPAFELFTTKLTHWRPYMALKPLTNILQKLADKQGVDCPWYEIKCSMQIGQQKVRGLHNLTLLYTKNKTDDVSYPHGKFLAALVIKRTGHIRTRYKMRSRMLPSEHIGHYSEIPHFLRQHDKWRDREFPINITLSVNGYFFETYAIEDICRMHKLDMPKLVFADFPTTYYRRRAIKRMRKDQAAWEEIRKYVTKKQIYDGRIGHMGMCCQVAPVIESMNRLAQLPTVSDFPGLFRFLPEEIILAIVRQLKKPNDLMATCTRFCNTVKNNYETAFCNRLAKANWSFDPKLLLEQLKWYERHNDVKCDFYWLTFVFMGPTASGTITNKSATISTAEESPVISFRPTATSRGFNIILSFPTKHRKFKVKEAAIDCNGVYIDYNECARSWLQRYWQYPVGKRNGQRNKWAKYLVNICLSLKVDGRFTFSDRIAEVARDLGIEIQMVTLNVVLVTGPCIIMKYIKKLKLGKLNELPWSIITRYVSEEELLNVLVSAGYGVSSSSIAAALRRRTDVIA